MNSMYNMTFAMHFLNITVPTLQTDDTLLLADIGATGWPSAGKTKLK